MQVTSLSELTSNELELWTLDDAEAWKEAEVGPAPEKWMEEDPLLDCDLWMEGPDTDTISIHGLGRLSLHFS